MRSALVVPLGLVLALPAHAASPPEATPTDAAPSPVEAAAARQEGSLQRCRQQALRRNPRVEGRIVVVWNVENERPREIRVDENSTGSSSLGACVLRQARRWMFAGVEDGSGRSTFFFHATPE